MQECAPSDDVGMCALFPCHLAQAEELVTEIKLNLQDDRACDVANINSPAQVYIPCAPRVIVNADRRQLHPFRLKLTEQNDNQI